MGSNASITGAVRKTSRAASATDAGAGAAHSDVVARLLRRRFLASMKLTSQAWKNSRSATGRASAPSAASSGKPSRPSASASLAFLALRSARRCDAPGANGEPDVCVCSPNAPNGRTPNGAEEAPARESRRAPKTPATPPAMVPAPSGVNAAPMAAPMGGSGVAATHAAAERLGRPIVRRTLSSTASPCLRPLSFSIISRVSWPGVNPSPSEPASDAGVGFAGVTVPSLEYGERPSEPSGTAGVAAGARVVSRVARLNADDDPVSV